MDFCWFDLIWFEFDLNLRRWQLAWLFGLEMEPILYLFQNIMNETGNIYGISVGFCFLLKGVNDTQAVESTIRAIKYYSNLCESMSITNL